MLILVLSWIQIGAAIVLGAITAALSKSYVSRFARHPLGIKYRSHPSVTRTHTMRSSSIVLKIDVVHPNSRGQFMVQNNWAKAGIITVGSNQPLFAAFAQDSVSL